MQPGVTVVLATVWLAVYVNVVGTVSHYPSRLTLDQYTPLPPQYQQHQVYRRVEGQPNWKDQNPGENQSFDLSIGPRRLISTNTTNGTSGIRYISNLILSLSGLFPSLFAPCMAETEQWPWRQGNMSFWLTCSFLI